MELRVKVQILSEQKISCNQKRQLDRCNSVTIKSGEKHVIIHILNKSKQSAQSSISYLYVQQQCMERGYYGICIKMTHEVS